MRGFAWIRDTIPEATDGILTSAGICEGFAGAGVSSRALVLAGFAGLVAGTLAMGTVEYSKQRAEHDRQVGQLAAERALLETAPEAEYGITPASAWAASASWAVNSTATCLARSGERPRDT